MLAVALLEWRDLYAWRELLHVRLRFGMERQALRRQCERMRGGPVQEWRDMLGQGGRIRVRMQRRLERRDV